MRRRREQAPFGAEEVHVEVGERGLRKVLEGDRDPSVLLVGDRRADELDVDVVAVGGEDQPVAVAGERRPQVDEAGDRTRKRRAVHAERSDLGVLGALGFEPGSEQGLLVRAGGLTVGRVRVDREARRHAHRGRADLRGRRDFRARLLRHTQVDVEARRRVGGGSRRLRVEAGIEAQLVAARGRRERGVGAGYDVVVGPDGRGGAVRPCWLQVVGLLRNGFSGELDGRRRGLAFEARVPSGGKAFDVVGGGRRHSPEALFDEGERQEMGDVFRRHIEAVVALGARVDSLEDREMEQREVEGDQARLARMRFQVVDRRSRRSPKCPVVPR